ncbi:unknown protein [Seminavis robusta]|uniref:Uncharacterized protein n=1 Tax=Seminavis robusta TaxID=568900 RepID=A0A9N8D7G6_9STRA|nr:unknown protein [Seminavis robusta]|eukprot:Sro6_g005670.1 n/a (252) ;mRNA; r:271019-271774
MVRKAARELEGKIDDVNNEIDWKEATEDEEAAKQDELVAVAGAELPSPEKNPEGHKAEVVDLYAVDANLESDPSVEDEEICSFCYCMPCEMVTSGYILVQIGDEFRQAGYRPHEIRYRLYREGFRLWKGVVGKNNRQPLPACFLAFIRGRHPNPEGQPYVGYKPKKKRKMLEEQQELTLLETASHDSEKFDNDDDDDGADDMSPPTPPMASLPELPSYCSQPDWSPIRVSAKKKSKNGDKSKDGDKKPMAI